MTHFAPSAEEEEKLMAPESKNDDAFGHFIKSLTKIK